MVAELKRVPHDAQVRAVRIAPIARAHPHPRPPLWPLQDLHRAELAYTAAVQTGAPELAVCSVKAAEDVSTFLCAVDLPRTHAECQVWGEHRRAALGGEATKAAGAAAGGEVTVRRRRTCL